MDRVRFVSHLGKQLLVIDFSKLGAREIEPVLATARKLIDTQSPGSLLTLTDVTGAFFDDQSAAAFKDYVTRNRPFVRAAAVVGVTGLKKIVLNVVRLASKREFELFDDVDLGMNWLARRK